MLAGEVQMMEEGDFVEGRGVDILDDEQRNEGLRPGMRAERWRFDELGFERFCLIFAR